MSHLPQKATDNYSETGPKCMQLASLGQAQVRPSGSSVHLSSS